jgi:SEC-C motif-containing protein
VLNGERRAATAVELMRSRYTGYATGRLDHVFASWHPRTRPDDLRAAPQVRWTGLRVMEVVDGGTDDDTGIVEFEATFTDAAGTHRMRERASFVRRAGRWVYLEALSAGGQLPGTGRRRPVNPATRRQPISSTTSDTAATMRNGTAVP